MANIAEKSSFLEVTVDFNGKRIAYYTPSKDYFFALLTEEEFCKHKEKKTKELPFILIKGVGIVDVDFYDILHYWAEAPSDWCKQLGLDDEKYYILKVGI